MLKSIFLFTKHAKYVMIKEYIERGFVMDFFQSIINQFKLLALPDIIDILLVATLVNFSIKRIKGSSAERILKGVSLLLVMLVISAVLDLTTINYIIENLAQIGLIAIVVVFQPELRLMLEKIGKTKLYRSNADDEELTEGEIIINEICDACERMSKAKDGALIVFERDSSLREIMESGISLQAELSSELLRNIFYPKAPLHDGAVIIASGKIHSASCILPLSKNLNISKDLGTRHRAGVGISEITDALCVIVSEETGAISIANKGMLKRHLSKDILKKLLRHELIPDTQSKHENGVFEFVEKHVDIILSRFKKKGE